VGGQLGIGEITVKAHRGQVMKKVKRQLAHRPRENGRSARDLVIVVTIIVFDL
jgi:hypothetical protein